MKPPGHHAAAEAVGLPALQEAFGKKNASLGAFYLGNWITDNSQLVEPVAMTGLHEMVSRQIKQPVHELIDEVVRFLYYDDDVQMCIEAGTALRSVRQLMEVEGLAETFEEAVKSLRGELDETIDVLLLSASESRDSKIAKLVRSTMYSFGYFKFVHKPQRSTAIKLSIEDYDAVFGDPEAPGGARSPGRGAGAAFPRDKGRAAAARPGGFTQYYPHEHYDRPAVGVGRAPGSASPGDAREIVAAPGPQRVGQHNPLGATPRRTSEFGRLSTMLPPGPRARSNTDSVERGSDTPDLYSYLRDQIEGTAGLLSELDDEFGAALARKPDPHDRVWLQTLAKAGHTLHQIEDFFAHSNFVELAVSAMGEDFVRRYIPAPTGEEYDDHAATTYARRLQRFINTPPNMETQQAFQDRVQEPEHWVVTGYFDFTDTIHALAHAFAAIFPWEVTDPRRDRHVLWEDTKRKASDLVDDPEGNYREAREAFYELCALAVDPKSAIADDQNKVAQWAKSKKDAAGKTLDESTRPFLDEADVRKLTRDLPIMRNVPESVIREFANGVILVSNAKTLGKTAKPLFEAIETIKEFRKGPWAFAGKWLVEKLTGLVTDEIKNQILFRMAVKADHGLGSWRVGSHALLAKDVDSKHTLFYKQAVDFATVAHGHVMRTLLRDRAEDPAGEHIDWLELLETIFRNPLTPQEDAPVRWVKIPYVGTRVHYTRPGEQLYSAAYPGQSLATRFGRSSVLGPMEVAADGKSMTGFTWRTIADANFTTRDMTDAEARVVINARLRDQGTGYTGRQQESAGLDPVAPPNYAFLPDTRLLIPFQKLTFSVPVPAPVQPQWWALVLEKNSWTAVQPGKNARLEQSTMGLAFHTPKYLSRADFDDVIDRGRFLRGRFREDYRPYSGAGGKRDAPTPTNDSPAWPIPAGG